TGRRGPLCRTARSPGTARLSTRRQRLVKPRSTLDAGTFGGGVHTHTRERSAGARSRPIPDWKGDSKPVAPLRDWSERSGSPLAGGAGAGVVARGSRGSRVATV